MKYTEASGTCTRTGCGRFTRVRGADKEDARTLLGHEHGHEFKHSFEGEVTFKEGNDKKD